MASSSSSSGSSDNAAHQAQPTSTTAAQAQPAPSTAAQAQVPTIVAPHAAASSSTSAAPGAGQPGSSASWQSDRTLDKYDSKYLDRRERPAEVVVTAVPDDKESMIEIMFLSPIEILGRTEGPWTVYMELTFVLPAFIIHEALPRWHARIRWARLNTTVLSWRCKVRAKIIFPLKSGGWAYARGCDFCEAHEQVCIYQPGKIVCDICEKKNYNCSAGGRPSTKSCDLFVQYLDKRVGLGRNPPGTLWEAPFERTYDTPYRHDCPKGPITKSEARKQEQNLELNPTGVFLIPPIPGIPELPARPQGDVIEALAARLDALEAEKRLTEAAMSYARRLYKYDHGEQPYVLERDRRPVDADPSAAQSAAALDAQRRQAAEETERIGQEAAKRAKQREEAERDERRRQWAQAATRARDEAQAASAAGGSGTSAVASGSGTSAVAGGSGNSAMGGGASMMDDLAWARLTSTESMPRFSGPVPEARKKKRTRKK